MELIKPVNYRVSYTDNFFFDTNVWLLLYGTIADFQRRDQRVYSNFLGDLLGRGNSIYITSMVISEFANVILRKDFKQWCLTNAYVDMDFKKDFVGSVQYKSTVQVVSNLISRILALPGILKISDEFSNININSILARFKNIDFNDAYIVEISELRDYIIVTNDKDFFTVDTHLKIISNQIP